MKTIVMMLFCACLVCVAVNAAVQNDPSRPQYTQEHLGKLYHQALMFEQAGLYDEARKACAIILSQTPDQPAVKKLMADIEGKQRTKKGPDLAGKLKKQLEEIVLPEVSFREVGVSDVIEYLQHESARHTKDKAELNFVLLLPKENNMKVTLSLRKISMLAVIRYVTSLSGLEYKIESNAVVISPPPKLAPAK
jgi:hypothetical protein